ncbi:hypothetical protein CHINAEXTREME_11580 [Halobiforma lacisalsi AJ5]|uniref:DUF302 domain-containing protein n=1 Tax=Natronobacterium lacisalsi AJ5 TaxID=358396 RepID=M0L4J2_NATLA|nr:DUF302 domain-containing protein [Halobiforma lacisalsi]APW98384.1 hypothetical protein CHINAEXTREME_11580 [Halobiforma lacisalsi AJ5]EMA27993.1 hypothetical protein C445_20127 [Halobiforma lacisalsi AJ5]
MDYTIQTSVSGDFDEVVDATIASLEDEGFGVLCDIDVQATLEEKLGEEFQQYRILGACNPALAHEGITEETELGALLPCNVIVYETDDREVVVSAVDPHKLLGIADNEALDGIATEVQERIERTLSAVTDDFEPASEA